MGRREDGKMGIEKEKEVSEVFSWFLILGS